MLSNCITRRLFVVPLAENDHGKTTMIRALVRQGQRQSLDTVKRCARLLFSPWGRQIDSLIIPRSYQETLRKEFGSIEDALDGVDSDWPKRDLVVFPSHLVRDDCRSIIRLAHKAGFDVIAVSILLEPDELPQYSECLALSWDERWTLHNGRNDNPDGQIDALGHDLWVWIASALERR